jgi:hypothetical protein
VPNRRRRKLSTAMSTVAALAVASPFAVITVSDLTASPRPAPQHHAFVQAAVVTDLPNELMSALQQGLAQFGINLPPLPTGLSPSGAQPASSPLTAQGLTAPNAITPGLTAPNAITPGLTAPNAITPGLTGQGLTAPAAGLPGTTLPATTPSLIDPSLTNPALTNPAAASPAATTPPGLTTPASIPNPALTSPVGLPGTTPGEVPIPVAGDPGLGGTYPVLGDPSLAGGAPSSGGGGGLMSDLTSAASQLGAGQAIDLLKGVMLPMITQAIQGASAQAAPPAPAPAA